MCNTGNKIADKSVFYSSSYVVLHTEKQLVVYYQFISTNCLLSMLLIPLIVPLSCSKLTLLLLGTFNT